MNSNNNNLVKKTSLGRRKIEIKKINNLSSRQVTFSKRRMGLFKKASELCILTGAEVAIIVHSSGNHVFSFGHPNVGSVINRYINGDGATAPANHRTPGDARGYALQYKQLYDAVRNELEAEKKREKIINREKQEINNGKFWWNEPIDNLGLEELEQYMAAVQELKNNVIMKADQLMLQENSSAAAAAGNIITNGGDFDNHYVDYDYGYGDDHQYYMQPYGSEFGKGFIYDGECSSIIK